MSIYDGEGNELGLNADVVLGKVAYVSGVSVVFKVSAITAGGSVTTSPLSADSSSVSAKQGDAGNLRVSAFSNDAGLLRVSTVGGTASSNDILVDGIDNTLSANILRVSGAVSSGQNGLVVYAQNRNDSGQLLISAKQGDAGLFRVSGILDSGSVSAKSGDANQVHVSAVQGDAALLRVSVVGTLTVSSHEVKQSDAASLLVSAKSGDANQVHVSAVQGDAALFRTSAILAAGVSSVGAASFGVSAAQNDAGALHASAYSGDANQVHVSSVQGDAALLRSSAFESVVTTNTGGASFYWTSAGVGSVASSVKSTAGRLYGYHLGNPAGVDQYLQIFNMSGGATPGTDVPALTLYVPTLGGAIMSLGAGIAFSTGIQIVGTSTVNGNSMGASAMRINIFYA